MESINLVNKVPLKQKLTYSIGQLGDSFGFNVFYFYFLFFMTDVAGIPAATAGTIALVAVAWDAITDPIVGYLSDNLKSKYGRRRPFMIGAAGFYGIATYLLFTNPDLSMGLKSLYFGAIGILFWTVYTSYVIPYFALGGEMTDNYQERTSLRVWASVGIYGAVWVASAGPPMIVSLVMESGKTLEQGWNTTGLFLGVAIILVIVVCWWGTKGAESAVISLEEKQQTAKQNFFKVYLSVFKLKPVPPFAVTILLLAGVTNLVSSGPVYLMSNNLGFSLQKQSLFFTVMVVVTLCYLPIINFLSNKLDKRSVYYLSCFISGIVCALFYLIGVNSFAIMIVWLISFEFCMVTFWTIYYAMMYDINELDQYVNGHAREGAITAILAFSQKIGAAISMQIMGVLLQLSGYDGMATTQPDSALDMIMHLNTTIPGVVMVIAGFITFKYPITKPRFEALQRALAARKEGREYPTDEFKELL